MQQFIRTNHPELITPEHEQILSKRNAMPIIQIDRLTLSDGTIVERSMYPIPFKDALESVATSYDGADTALYGHMPPEYVSSRIDIDEDLHWKSATFMRMDTFADLHMRAVPVIASAATDGWTVAMTTRVENDNVNAGDIATVKTDFQHGFETLADAVTFVDEWFASCDAANLNREISMTIIAPGGNAADLVNVTMEDDTHSYARHVDAN